MAFSNPGNAAYYADLGITIKPARVMHGTTWRPHPILGWIPVVSIPRGQTGWGIRTMADFSAALSFAENTALTDQAMPTITSVNPTLVGRGFSYSQTVQGRQRVADEDWGQLVTIRDQKVSRVIMDDLTNGSTNGITALSSGITDVTTDAAGNASLDGLLTCIDAVGKPAVAFYDAVGVRGIVDSIRAEGGLYANSGLSDQVRRIADTFQPDSISDDGFVLELFGCRVYQTNDRSGDGSRLYEDGGITHGIVMADTKRRLQAAQGGGSLYQYQNVAPPIILMGRADPIPDMPRVNESVIEWLKIENPPMAEALGINPGQNIICFASWFDVGINVAGHKRDFGGEFDPILANGGYARCHQYLSSYQS